jgi:hypothetical protein
VAITANQSVIADAQFSQIVEKQNSVIQNSTSGFAIIPKIKVLDMKIFQSFFQFIGHVHFLAEGLLPHNRISFKKIFEGFGLEHEHRSFLDINQQLRQLLFLVDS